MRLVAEGNLSSVEAETMVVMARLCFDTECETTPALCETCPLNYESKEARRAFKALLVSHRLCDKGMLNSAVKHRVANHRCAFCGKQQ